MKKYKFKLFDNSENELHKKLDTHLWPFYSYEIIAPKIESKDLFVKLYIDLIRMENKKAEHNEFAFEDIMLKRVRRQIKTNFPQLFSNELIEKIEKNIREIYLKNSKVIDKEKYEMHLESPISMSANLQKITLLQDAITGEVVPYIDLIKDYNSLTKSKLDNVLKMSNQDRPSLLSIQKAYKLAKIIGDTTTSLSSKEEVLEDDFTYDNDDEIDDDFFDSFVKDDEIQKPDTKKKKVNRGSEIIFLQKSPKVVAFEFASYGNITTGETVFSSPFDTSSDHWFNKIVKRSRTISESVDKLLISVSSKVLSMHQDYLKKNEVKIEKELKKPEVAEKIANDKLKPLVETLDDKHLLESYNEILKLRTIKASTLYTEYGKFLEGLFHIIIQRYDCHMDKIKDSLLKGRRTFESSMKFLSLKGIKMVGSYTCEARYKQMTRLVKGKYSNKEYLLTKVVYLLLLDTYAIDTLLTNILKRDKEFLLKIDSINNNRNMNSHYNQSVKTEYTKAEEEFTYVVTELINQFREEE